MEHIGYINGYPDGYVKPENDLTRAEAAVIFDRLLDDEIREYFYTRENPYPDVDKDSWYNDAISTLSNIGVLVGEEDGLFKPDAEITRAELAAIAARFARFMPKIPHERQQFNDVNGHWAEDDINYLAAVGWIEGYPEGPFNPDLQITRAESMAFVNRILGRLQEPDDERYTETVNGWADNSDPNAWYYNIVIEASTTHAYR
jgi:hypothetical protein